MIQARQHLTRFEVYLSRNQTPRLVRRSRSLYSTMYFPCNFHGCVVRFRAPSTVCLSIQPIPYLHLYIHIDPFPNRYLFQSLLFRTFHAPACNSCLFILFLVVACRYLYSVDCVSVFTAISLHPTLQSTKIVSSRSEVQNRTLYHFL